MANERWPIVALGTVLKERKEIVTKKDLKSRGMKLISKISFSDGCIHFRENNATKTKLILIKPGDLVLSGINAAKGAVALYADTNQYPAAATIHYSAYEIDTDLAVPKYLWWLLRSDSFRVRLSMTLRDGIKMELKAKRLLPVPISLPPLDVQLIIVRQIERLYNKYLEFKSNLESRVTLEENLAKSAVDKAFAQLSSRAVKFEEFLVDRPRNGWSPPASFYREYGTPVLTLSAVTGFKFDNSKVKFTQAQTSESAHYWLRPKELLVTRSNTPELVGHAAIYEGPASKYICPDLIMKMTVDPAKANVRFVHYWFQTSTVRQYMRLSARGISGTMKKIRQKDLLDLPIPSVSLNEQHRIVRQLNQLYSLTDRLGEIDREIRAIIDNFMPAMLNAAFEGDLIDDINPS